MTEAHTYKSPVTNTTLKVIPLGENVRLLVRDGGILMPTKDLVWLRSICDYLLAEEMDPA